MIASYSEELCREAAVSFVLAVQKIWFLRDSEVI
jgi:hypothetical protein